jgi:hypothetical protein
MSMQHVKSSGWEWGIHRQQWLGVFEVSCEKVATVEQCCIVDDSSGC